MACPITVAKFVGTISLGLLTVRFPACLLYLNNSVLSVHDRCS